MTVTLNRFTLSTLTAGALMAAGSVLAQPAQAFTFSSDKTSVTITGVDINKSFTVLFDGSVNNVAVPELESEAVFTFLGFTTVGSVTEAAFNVVLSNTSTIASRVSSVGFDVNRALVGVGQAGGANPGNTRVSGIFDRDNDGAGPSGLGSVDVCFSNSGACSGGGGPVAVSPFASPAPSGVFAPTLALSGANISSFTLSNFAARYQDITGLSSNGTTYNGASGTGAGLVPTPAMLPGLIGMGVAALRKRKSEEAQDA